MSEKGNIPLLEMFPFLEGAGNLHNARVVSLKADKAHTFMRITVEFSELVPPVEINELETAIAGEFELAEVRITPVFPMPEEPKGGKKKKAAAGTVILGRKITGSFTAIELIELDLGKANVRGVVCDVSTREIPKRKAWLLSFDITDFTGTVHVSKFMTDAGAGELASKITQGMCLEVSGNIGINRFDGDINIEPVSIVVSSMEHREDEAAEKRVELHLHTKMSALDAVTDVEEAVKRAKQWGHKAIAITDHGVAHSFPDAMKAAGGDIKVIYGVEGYYVNDIDDKISVFGDIDCPLDGEYVVFDIETTGLSAFDDRLTEIGAVIVRDGKELARFETFANPEMAIPPEITRLTGIKDADVAEAPSQEEAVRAFLEFCGDRPLVAHNADFDVGFIFEACLRYKIAFTPRYVDTLALARSLLPKLKSHRLNVVADFLGLPEFSHHRAAEDAVTTAGLLANFFRRLSKDGISNASEINGYIEKNARGNVPAGRYKPKHIIILAQNQTGIKNLYKLITKSHIEHFNRFPIISKSLISEHREGLIIGSACEAGEVFSLITDRRSSLTLTRISEFYDYLEIQPVSNNMFMLNGDKPRAGSIEELQDFNRRVVGLGAAMGKPVVATGDVHFLDPEDEIFRRVLLASKGFEDYNRELPLYFQTTDEMLEEFSYLGEETAYEVVVKNTNLIAEMCEAVRPLPPAKTLYSPKIENSAEDLKKLVYDRLEELYGEKPCDLIKNRVETELNDILAQNYDVIYITAHRLVADSLKNGYLVGSRGSVGSSIVAFLADITEVNSLPAHYRCPSCKNADFEPGRGYGCGADMPDAVCPLCGVGYVKEGFDIPFETFLGFGGDKVPDIDLNFSGEYQANAHRFTNELFGAEHVFRAGTIGTIAEKTAYGFVKKYLESIGKQVTKAEENRLSRGCVGVKRTTGQHPGGLVIIPQDMEITDFCPAQHPADAGDGGIVTTHFEYHSMEDNLLKLDELGHDDPTMIRMLEDLTGIDARKIRLDDCETMAIFKSPEPLGLPVGDEIIGPTGSIGIPEFGTGFTRQMLCDTQPGDFDTLVRLSGFSHGTDVWLGNAKDIILNGVAGIRETIGCRDDIMLFLISKGMDEKFAFKSMESVRKGRGLPDGAAEEMKERGVPEWYIESCRKIKYLFPKAHAVAYVMMAFRIAWFKVHRPLEFYSAYFFRRSQKDGFDAEYMTKGIEVVRRKIREIRNSIDVKAKEEELLTTLEACYEFYMRGFKFAGMDLYESDAVKFTIADEKTLRPPFVAISGLGETAAYDIVEKRRDRDFVAIDEFSALCSKVSKTHIEQMKNAGAFRDMPETSQMTLF